MSGIKRLSDEIVGILQMHLSEINEELLVRLLSPLKIKSHTSIVAYSLLQKQILFTRPLFPDFLGRQINSKLDNDFTLFKNNCHPVDFANLVFEVANLTDSEPEKCIIIKPSSELLQLRMKDKKGVFKENRVQLIYMRNFETTKYSIVIGVISRPALHHKLTGIKITSREKEVFKLLSIGNSSKMIAARLEISITTVITHRKNLIRKLNACNSAEMIKKGFELNLHY